MKRRQLMEGLLSATFAGLLGSVAGPREKLSSDYENPGLDEMPNGCWERGVSEEKEKPLPFDNANYTVTVDDVTDDDILGEFADIEVYNYDAGESYHFNVEEGDYIELPIGYIEVAWMINTDEEGYVYLKYNEGF